MVLTRFQHFNSTILHGFYIKIRILANFRGLLEQVESDVKECRNWLQSARNEL